jgi:cytochrome c553
MRRRLIYLVSVVAALILIQFIRPEKNLGELVTETDLIQVSQVPDSLASVLLNSCYDCHSNHTNYPWYSNVAPFSWYLNNHVVEGKAHLNFSSWGIMDKAQKITQLDQMCEEITYGTMPLNSYLWIHRSSKLSDQDIQAICEWAEAESLKILSGE